MAWIRGVLRFAWSVALLGWATAAWAEEGVQGFYRFPALHGDTVVFVAEGDLWKVSAQGGRAERITTHPDQELRPAISANGQWLAYNASYEGPSEAYVMPLAGGVPRRLTWDARAPVVWGFTPAGEVLVSAGSESGRPMTQLYAIDPVSLARHSLPVAQASDGAVAQDGRTLVFTRDGLRGDNARNYRGGAMARLWTLDMAGSAEAQPLVALNANARRPMPYTAGGQARVAFLSDRDGFYNVWSVDAQGQDLRQHTHHRQWDVRHASIHGSRVVYALGANLHLVDLASDKDQRLAITLGGDFDQQRPRWVGLAPYLTSVALAPNGERVVLAARGHLATQGAAGLRRAELQVPPTAACRGAVFSHDSRHVFAMCDSSGEVEIWRFAADGTGTPRQITNQGGLLRRVIAPSPDGRWLAHTDHAGRLYLTALTGEGAGATKQLGQARARPARGGLRWSADGKALVIEEFDLSVRRSRMVLYTLADGQLRSLGSDRYESSDPAFTPDGRWLYFLSDRRFVSSNPSPWGDRNLGPSFDRRTRIYALALQPGLRLPFMPRDELTPASPAPAASAASSAAAASAPSASASQAARGLVVAGLAQRLFELPVPPGNYSALRTDGKRLFFLDREAGGESRSSLRSVPIDDSGTPPEALAADVLSFDITPDGKRMMIVRSPPPPALRPNETPRAGEILLFDTAARLPAELAKAQVRWADWQTMVEPRSEWQQMFNEAWRLHRDHLFDPGMNGADWPALRAQHAALLPRVTDRAELAELMAQMAAGVGVLHSAVISPDQRRGPELVPPAALGGRFSKVAEGWRVDHVFRGDPELPGDASPLARADVRAGDVITTINGRSTRNVPALSELLRGEAGRQVLLQLKSPSGAERAAVLLPITPAQEESLRTSDWEWSLAERTLDVSKGRIGYLRLRAMTGTDIGTFAREFYSHFHRDGLVIDMRSNNGGYIDSWVLEKLMRRAWMFWQPRAPEGAEPYWNMQQAFRGQLVVLIDSQTYSDGETFAEGVRRLGLGTLVGQRTAGAGVWLSDSNALIDNGRIRAAETAVYALDGSWLIEGRGVAPDVEVDLPPRATANGGDAQLDAAIALLQKRLAEQPLPQPKPPPYARPMARPAPN